MTGKKYSIVSCDLMFDNAEVERALLDHPDIAEAALRTMPDSRYKERGQVLVLYLRLKGELADKQWYILAELDAFRNHIKDHLKSRLGIPANTLVLVPLPIIVQIVKLHEGNLSEAADRKIKELEKRFAEDKTLRYHQV